MANVDFGGWVFKNDANKQQYIEKTTKDGFSYNVSNAPEKTPANKKLTDKFVRFVESTSLDKLYVDVVDEIDTKSVLYTEKEIEDVKKAISTKIIGNAQRNEESLVSKRYDQIKTIFNQTEVKISLSHYNNNAPNFFKTIPNDFVKKLKEHRYVSRILRVFAAKANKHFSKREPAKLSDFLNLVKMCGMFHVRNSITEDKIGYASYFTFIELPQDELKIELQTGRIASKIMEGEELGRSMTDEELTSTIEDIVRFILILKAEGDVPMKDKKEDPDAMVYFWSAEFRIY
jgi:hypothetical protein